MIDFVLCVCAFMMSFALSLFLYRPSHTQLFQNMSSRGGIAVILSTTLCAAISMLLQSSTGEVLFFPIFLWAVGLSLYGLTSHRINRFWTYLMVCGLSVLVFPEQTLFFRGALPLILDRCVVALLWAASLHVAATLRSVPALMLTFIKLHLLALILLSMWLLRTPELGWLLAVCLSAQLGFSVYAKNKPFLRQGISGIVPAMYLIGFFWLWMITQAPTEYTGVWVGCFVAYAYLFEEVIYSSVYRYLFRKRQEPKMLSFFYVQALQRHLDHVPIMASFFNRRWTILVLLAVVLALFRAPLSSLVWTAFLVLGIIALEMGVQVNTFKEKTLPMTSVFSIFPMCKELVAGVKTLFSKHIDE